MTPKPPVFLIALGAAMAISAKPGAAAAQTAMQNGVYEAELKSSARYGNPVADAEVRLEFTSPSSQSTSVLAFWDGADVWRARFSPTASGTWRWRSTCSDRKNSGLHGREGSFECVPYKGKNPVLARGPLKLSANRRYLIHADGTPFFWLADTAWNGVLRAKPGHWDKYLSTRRSQGFTAVQFVSTHWRSYSASLAYTGKNDVEVNPEFFRRLDAKVKAINDYGMVAAPVILWAIGGNDPGYALSEADAIRLAKYIVARWGAYNVLWILGGDGNYRGNRAEKWKRIGRAVFGDQPDKPATMHPGGLQWVADEFRREQWYSFIGYQSGHGDSTDAVKWLVQGAPAVEWGKSPALPVVNLEPNYEGLRAYGSKTVFDALAVRKALYRSLLVSPTAGVTYGHHGIWYWTELPEVPMAHPNTGIALPWHQALYAEGATSVRHLSRCFESIKWWTLSPDPTLIVNPPTDPFLHIASARNEDGSLAVIYLPDGGAATLNARALKRPLQARWFDPRTGEYTPAGRINAQRIALRAPGSGDWVLAIGK